MHGEYFNKLQVFLLEAMSLLLALACALLTPLASSQAPYATLVMTRLASSPTTAAAGSEK